MSDATATPKRDPREITFPYEFRLTKTVKAHGDETNVLVLREPVGDDIVKFGLLDGFESAIFVPLVCSLAAVPEGAVKAMAGRDVLSLATVLARFFQWAAQPPA